MRSDFKNFAIEVKKICPSKTTLRVYIKNLNKSTKVSYLAAQPPDYIQSYTGSAMPFPDAEIAFQETKNKDSFKPTSSTFDLTLRTPNSYYSHLGSRIIPPHVIFTVETNGIVEKEVIELGEIAPFRTLSYQSVPAARISPSFYDRSTMKLGRSQEEILRSSGYRLTTPNNFWGGAVPHT